MPDATDYSERLHVPLRWWVQATMLLASLWLAFVVAMPLWAASTATVALLLAVFGFFAWIGSVGIVVSGGELRAGRAHIALGYLGACAALDADETRRVLGVDADARAFLLVRPYLKRSVQIRLVDPADPTPYWLLSTRHPHRLAAVLGAGRPVDTP